MYMAALIFLKCLDLRKNAYLRTAPSLIPDFSLIV